MSACVPVELDQAGQVRWVPTRSGGQVRVDVVLELHEQRRELGLEDLVQEGQLDVDDRSRPRPQPLDRRVQQGDDLGILAGGRRHTPIRLPRNASGCSAAR